MINSTVLSVTWIFKCNNIASPLVPKSSSTSVLYAIVIHFKTVLLLTCVLDFFILPLRPTSRPLELGGPFRLFFWKKYWEIVGFFKKNFTKMAYLFESGYFKTFSFSQAESYNNIHKGFARNLPTICIPSCHAKILEYSHPPPPKKNHPMWKRVNYFYIFLHGWMASPIPDGDSNNGDIHCWRSVRNHPQMHGSGNPAQHSANTVCLI